MTTPTELRSCPFCGRQLKIANKMNAERNANSATIVLGEIKPPKQPIDPMGYTE